MAEFFFSLTEICSLIFQILTLYLAPDTKTFYVLVDNRPWLEDLPSRPAHLWQLMVTKNGQRIYGEASKSHCCRNYVCSCRSVTYRGTCCKPCRNASPKWITTSRDQFQGERYRGKR